jgi:hypothetical protein
MGRSKEAARIDYGHLSDEELHGLLCLIAPEMSRFSVNEWTRRTAIAMLETAIEAHHGKWRK